MSSNNVYRVRSGPRKPGKSWNFIVAFSRTAIIILVHDFFVHCPIIKNQQIYISLSHSQGVLAVYMMGGLTELHIAKPQKNTWAWNLTPIKIPGIKIVWSKCLVSTCSLTSDCIIVCVIAVAVNARSGSSLQETLFHLFCQTIFSIFGKLVDSFWLKNPMWQTPWWYLTGY